MSIVGIRKTVIFLGGLRPDGEFAPYGTGFLVSRGFGDGWGVAYLVTAKHILTDIESSGLPLAGRVNQRGGNAVVGQLRTDNWHTHPTMPHLDLAVTRVGISSDAFDTAEIDLEGTALTDDYIATNGIGFGDKVYTVGLLTKHFGRSRNVPIVRTGNIAALPEEPVDLGEFGEQHVYLIESRSIGGLSGSPVLLPTPIYRVIKDAVVQMGGHKTEYLLGMNIGFFEAMAHADRMRGEKLDARDAFLETVNAGIAVVIPVQRIVEIIDSPELVEQRRKAMVARQSGRGFVPTSSVPKAGKAPIQSAPDADNPDHKEGFMRLLNAAGRKQPRDGQT